MTHPAITVGLQVPCAPPLGLNRALVYAARLGRLDTVWAIDHLQLFFPSALWDRTTSWAAAPGSSPHAFFDFQTVLGYLAPTAGRLRLGVGVTDPTRRHPVLLAQAMLTLAHMTRRPPILGLGAGLRLNLEPYGLDVRALVGRLEEALQVIRLCFASPGPIDFQGRHYRLDGAVMGLRPPTGRTPEIWVAGTGGPRMLLLAGRHGDGWFPALISSPEEYADKLAVVRAAAQEAGRDPEALTPSLWQSVLVAPTEREARAMLESTLVRTLSLVYAPAEAWRTVGAEHPFGERYRAADLLPERYDRATWRQAIARLPPELLGYGFVWGTPEQVADRLRAFGEAGLRHVALCHWSPLLSRRAVAYVPWATRRIARLLRGGG
jgi:phthiodiolone/phenolphthiodiolone dimycocerosates ketoreductase